MIEFLELFLFGNPGIQQAIDPLMFGAALFSAGTQIIGSFIGGGARRRAERDAQNRVAQAQRTLSRLEAQRQAITNPYSGVQNLSGLAVDLSSNLTNPFANLSVATQAAEIQMEQSDIALANTLDTLRATGSGSGGATALAQAALQSKKGVSADIEKQETNNERLKAQGEQQLDRMRMQEAARVQGIQIAEGGRTQGLDAAGKQFMFTTKENRQMAGLDRASAQLAGAQGQAMQASAARQANTAGLISGLAGVGGSLLTGLASQNPYGGMRDMATTTLDAMQMSGGGMSANIGNTASAYTPSINTSYTPSWAR